MVRPDQSAVTQSAAWVVYVWNGHWMVHSTYRAEDDARESAEALRRKGRRARVVERPRNPPDKPADRLNGRGGTPGKKAFWAKFADPLTPT